MTRARTIFAPTLSSSRGRAVVRRARAAATTRPAFDYAVLCVWPVSHRA